MNLTILEKFTIHLRHTLSHSIHLAWKLHHEAIQPVFLLYGLTEQKGSLAGNILEKHHLSGALIEDYLAGGSQKKRTTKNVVGVSPTTWPEFAPATKRLIEAAAMLAMEFKHAYIGTEHLLLAMIQKPDRDILGLLQSRRISRDHVSNQLLNMMTSTSKFSEIQSFFSSAQSKSGIEGKEQPQQRDQQKDKLPASTTPALDYFGIDLTSEKHAARIDPVIGREDEINRLIHILSRRTKNNPVLVGDPGVGKTAIVEGLAKKIVAGQVPEVLLSKRIIGIDLSLVVAGSMYRGEFESRLKQIIEETKANSDVILFIDEIHMLVGAGGVSGGNVDAANILKPALAKGEIRCIGATTGEEYRKYIEHDAALDRRFQPIRVKEPSEAEAIEILKGLRRYYEDFHHIRISDDVVTCAVRWSIRYLPERRLPDKAIDLIDEAGAKLYVNRKSPAALKRFEELNRQLKKILRQKEAAVHAEQFQLVMKLKKKEDALMKKSEAAFDEVERLKLPVNELSLSDIAAAVSNMTNIPVEHILATGKERFKHVESTLRQFVMGQDIAIKNVTSVLKRSYAGLSSPDKPLGSFLFLGPSGVGKTHLAKVIAEHVFGDPNALIRMDMSEFTESFSISKLIGAPAGYVGYNDGVKLSDQIRKKPYSVVLFDEIEKAHPDIFNMLLQVLDEGRLTDSTNRELNFRNAVIILTSNVGIHLLTKQAEIGFDDAPSKEKEMEFAEIESTILSQLPDYFPAEFLNRIDHEIVFRPLDEKSMERIVALAFQDVAARLSEQGITVTLSAEAATHLARESYNPKQGARFVRKKIAELVEGPLADQLLSGVLQHKDTVTIEWNKKAGIQFKKPAKKTRKKK